MVIADNKYVIFRLNGEEFGIDINGIKEVSEYLKITRIPGSPYYVEGVKNLRGGMLNEVVKQH